MTRSKQCLGGQAGRRPAFDEGIQIARRVNHQGDKAQRPAAGLFPEDGNHNGHVNGAIGGIAVQIKDRDLPGAETGGGILPKMRHDYRRRFGSRHPHDTLGIHQEDSRIAEVRLVFGYPCLEQPFGVGVLRCL